MPNYICVTCGNQHGASARPPDRCPICEDAVAVCQPQRSDVDDPGCDAAGLSQRPGTA